MDVRIRLGNLDRAVAEEFWHLLRPRHEDLITVHVREFVAAQARPPNQVVTLVKARVMEELNETLG